MGTDTSDSDASAPPRPQISKFHDTAISMFAGATAGAVSRTVTAPADRLKTLMQAGRGVPLRPPNMSQEQWHTRFGSFSTVRTGGVQHACMEVWREGGWKGFWRGNGTNVIKVIPDEALKYTVKRRLTEALSGNADQGALWQHILAGSASGVASQTLIYPLELTKTRMTVATTREYSGIFDCIARTWKEGGIRAFYKGFGPNLCGIIPFQGTYFGLFFFLTGEFEHQTKGKIGLAQELSYSAQVSTAAVLVSYPFNLVRTKLQIQGVNGRPILYSGMIDCFKSTIRHEGLRGCYRGLVPNYIKALPSLSISLVLVKSINDALRS